MSSLDWQPVNDSISHSRTRKESNTSASRFSESFDTGEDNVTQDNLWFSTVQRNQVYHSDDDEASQASWAENGYKSNNLGLPDKAQVATRLNQIRDYVSQTMNMMEGLRASGGQRNMAQHEKLASMLEGLRDSEIKLQTLYERLQRMPPSLPQGESDGFPAHQAMESPREGASKTVSSVPKTSEATRKNELKKQVQISQLKLQELQEQQAALKALKQKAQEQLNEARAAQGALVAAHNGLNQQSVNADNMIQERLHNLQRFFDTRQQLVQMVGLDEAEGDTSEVQNKLDELQAKKQHMDQLLAQFSNIHSNNEELSPEECERDMESKIAELNAMRDFLATFQSNTAAQLRPLTPQERVVKKDSRAGSVEKSNASSSSQTLQAKTQQLNDARAKLHQLQTLLQTVEELRNSGQPIPESVLQLMSNSDNSSSPTHPDRSYMSSQDLNVSQPVNERLVNSCERGDLFCERSSRPPNSCERERVKHQPPANATKHKNQEGKLSTKLQLEELIRNQEIGMPQPLQSSSFQENGTTTGTWGGSTQGTVDEGFNPEYSGDMNESASVKNISSSSQPHNVWRKPSSDSVSRYSWTSPYVPQEMRRVPDSGPQPSVSHSSDIPPQPDSHWVVQQISQLQSQLQQMSGLYKNFVEKQHNCPPPWLTPNNISAALGPYCQYIASASQWQQQQLLVHSLNQCCQLIWHQQREMAALKEALRLIQQPPIDGALFSSHQTHQTLENNPTTSHSNLSRTSRHAPLKPSLSAGPSLAPPAPVSSAHSLPNLASPQTSPASPTPVNNRNLLSSPTATVLSLPPNLNNSAPPPSHNPNVFFNPNSQFTEPNFINLYPPYGNNLNFEFPSPVNFFPNPPEPFIGWTNHSSQPPPPATTLNNQVPPGNRANNYWDNFRSYSRQNLLSNSGKSNDGLPQRTPMERFLNTDPLHQPPQSRKERLNIQSRPVQEPEGEEGEIGEASGYHQPQQLYTTSCHQHNLCVDQPHTHSHTQFHGRTPVYSPHCFQNNMSNDAESRTTRLVNDCEAPRGANKKVYSLELNSEQKVSCNKRNYMDSPARDAKINYHTETHQQPGETITETSDSTIRSTNLVNSELSQRARRNPRNLTNNIADNAQQNCIGDGYCLMASESRVRRKDNRGNIPKDCKTESSRGGDSLEECVYSEVAALISVNEWRPQYLLQLFKDLRLLSSCPDPNMQAALSSTIHNLASRTNQEENGTVNPPINDDLANNHQDVPQDNSTQQPRNWNLKETPPPQLPTNCAKLDWEVRSILVEMLPFIKSQLGETCGPALLEAVRKLILHLVPSQSTQEQLDAQLEDALHKFHGCRLGEVYEELLTVVADVLISELTFLRLVNTVHHASDQQNEDEVEVEEEEGAVGGVVEEPLPPSIIAHHPANQSRRSKSETVSEADLAEADQSRHTASGGEEERGDTAEGIDQLEEEAVGRDLSMVNCNGHIATEPKTEAGWAVEQDQELGLDQVPTRLHNPEIEQDACHSYSLPSSSNTGPSEPNPI